MDFGLTPEQEEIRRTARELLARRCPPERVRELAEARAYDDSLWTELWELGWPLMAISEERGGGGFGCVELALVMEELGYGPTPTPMLATAAAALVLDAAAGPADDRLEKLAGERGIAALGRGSGLVADGRRAGLVVVVENGIATLLDRDAATVEAVETIDPTRDYARVRGPGEALPGEPGPGVRRACVALAAEQLGICRRALDLTVAYVKERRQFDVPIGAFQAISHRCARMLERTEATRSAVYAAAWAVDADPEGAVEATSIAVATAADAAIEVTAAAIQAHGAIGFTWEADLHWLYKRAQLDAQLLGSPAEERRALARILADRRSGARG